MNTDTAFSSDIQHPYQSQPLKCFRCSRTGAKLAHVCSITIFLRRPRSPRGHRTYPYNRSAKAVVLDFEVDEIDRRPSISF